MIARNLTGQWRATKEIAKQDAIRAGLGIRDPVTGLASINPDVRFEIAEGECNLSDVDLLEGDALAVLVVHGRKAEAFARTQMAINVDPAECGRWQRILRAIGDLRKETGAGGTLSAK